MARLGIQDTSKPLDTNKFYANFFLGNQNQGVWAHPYVLTWSKGAGQSGSWGMAISHLERSQTVYGPGTPAAYFINPVGIQSIVLSAQELGSTTQLTTDTLEAFSVNANLVSSSGASPAITFPVLQGMGFVTAVYKGSTPLIQSGVGFSSLTPVGPVNGGSTTKYRAGLNDGTTWLIYVTPDSGSMTLSLTSGKVSGSSSFAGTIQVAKVPTGSGSAESIYDSSAGVYANSATVSASASDSVGTYSLSWTKAGLTSNTLLMFALPHHQASMDSTTSGAMTSIQLQTTTKGVAVAVQKDSWTLEESEMPISMGFGPWSQTTGSVSSLSSTAQAAVVSAAQYELSEDMEGQTDTDSMYYSGKVSTRVASTFSPSPLLTLHRRSPSSLLSFGRHRNWARTLLSPPPVLPISR